VFVLGKKRLKIILLFVARSCVTRVPNRRITHESFRFAYVFINIEDESFIFNVENAAFIHHRNTASFLAAMLQRKKTKLRQRKSVKIHVGINTENTALFRR